MSHIYAETIPAAATQDAAMGGIVRLQCGPGAEREEVIAWHAAEEGADQEEWADFTERHEGDT